MLRGPQKHKRKDSFKIGFYFVFVENDVLMNISHNNFGLLLKNGPSRIILWPIKI